MSSGAGALGLQGRLWRGHGKKRRCLPHITLGEGGPPMPRGPRAHEMLCGGEQAGGGDQAVTPLLGQLCVKAVGTVVGGGGGGEGPLCSPRKGLQASRAKLFVYLAVTGV